MLEMQNILEPAITAAVAVIGWWIKGIKSDLSETKEMVHENDKKLDALRNELRSEMKGYVPKDMCDARCEALKDQIKIMRDQQEMSLAQAVNDTRRMHALYDSMTPAERRAHAAQCLFKGDMEGIG